VTNEKTWIKLGMIALFLALGIVACGPAVSPGETPPSLINPDSGEQELELEQADDPEVSQAEGEETTSDSEEEQETAADQDAGADQEEATEQDVPDDSTFDVFGGASEDDFTTTATGLQYIINEEGTGASPENGELVSVHYTGWLEDGTQFDSSVDRGQPFQFPLGQGMVVQGWDEGVAFLKEGGKGRLIIPPELGYGPTGSGGVIPPEATLIFDVELIEILPGPPEDPEDIALSEYTETDSGLSYYDLEIGDGSVPEEGQQLLVHYTGWLEDGTQFDSSLMRGQPIVIVLGSEQALEGWHEALATMNVGGKRQIIVPPELAFGEEGAGGGIIPPDATLVFQLELLEVQ
jgi:peptidylprolyl isomerase